ncbi:hypothetical protein AtubIFM57258_006169 [Aspergillus tubingensis]|nr:hypothetical protein AtubIFM57258_006169 [Aspergillus tubingensis]
MLFLPRLHLFEIADQPWCPHKAIEYAQLCLTHCWNLRLPPIAKASSAEVACEVLADNFPDLSSFTFVDLGSGAGGPSATFERLLNARLRAQHLLPAQFLLTDLNPSPREWAALTKQQENISYISEPVDASKCGRLVPQNRKECRMFNVAFHHFDDPLAIPMLRSAIESADAFIIFELTARDLSSMLILPGLILIACQYTLLRFWRSPLHLIFTFVVPLAPLLMVFDGFVSIMRCRTSAELRDLVRRTDAPGLENWEFRSGKSPVMYPTTNVHWFMGVKKTAK